MKIKQGWAVQITNTDGTTRLSGTGMGELPGVWKKTERRWAAQMKNSLMRDMEGTEASAKVVSVKYTDPVISK
jgi:hypothetical protein